jgi:hypothetical protein
MIARRDDTIAQEHDACSNHRNRTDDREARRGRGKEVDDVAITGLAIQRTKTKGANCRETESPGCLRVEPRLRAGGSNAGRARRLLHCDVARARAGMLPPWVLFSDCSWLSPPLRYGNDFAGVSQLFWVCGRHTYLAPCTGDDRSVSATASLHAPHL